MSERITEYTRGPHTFDVIDSGPIDGIPVVLLHGFPQRAHSWSRVAQRLNDAGLRTIAPDQRGYSPGARPQARRDYRLGELVGDVIALIDAIGVQQAHVVGHDWGSAVAWAVAGKHPERVASLTTISVPHPRAFMAAMPRGQAISSWYMAFFNLPRVPEWLLTKAFGSNDRVLRQTGLPTEDARRLRTDIVEYGALTGALNWYRGLVFSARDRHLPAVTVPTTYIWSDRDVALGRVGARLTSGWVDAPYEFITIEHANHWLPENHPDEVAGAIADRVDSVESRIS